MSKISLQFLKKKKSIDMVKCKEYDKIPVLCSGKLII